MKVWKVAVPLTVVALLAGGFFLATPSDAKQSALQEAKQAVEKYIEAIKNGNVDEMLKTTVDKRFNDDSSKRRAYETLAKEKDQKAEILSVDRVDDTRMQLSLRVYTKAAGTQEITLPVVKENNEWKVVIEKRVVQPNGQ